MQPKQQSSSASNFVHVPTDRFREVCLRNGGENCKETITILENLFNPEKPLNDSNCNVDILKSYITGNVSYDTFKTKLKSYDTSSVCGLVWNVNYIAYRCRTCALSPCMSICADCFKNGDHEGHDYNMFRSGAGGACDCGDDHVMSPNGFCKNHGCNKKSAASSPPQDLIKCSKVILPNLLYRILQHFRSSYTGNRTEFNHNNQVLADIAKYVDFLNDLCSTGTPLRKIFVDFLVSEDFYQEKIELEKLKISENCEKIDLTYQHQVYLGLLKNQKPIAVPDDFADKKKEICQLDHHKMIDEYLFWCIKYELPENLVKFLLSLLPDSNYKQIFVKSFVNQYSYILTMLIELKLENFSSRVVHISVQLFSDEAIAVKAMTEFNLLPIFLSTIYSILNNTNVKNFQKTLLNKNLLESDANSHLVVDPDHPILQDNLYWLPISDLSNLLSHKRIAQEFLHNSKIIKLWIDLVAYFQSMNLNIREYNDHLQYDSVTYFSSFSAELEFCSSIMWSLLQHTACADKADLSINILKLILDKLISWLSQITLMDMNNCNNIVKRPNPNHVSFHLPLHRYFSSFLYNALTTQNLSLCQVMEKIFTFDFNRKQYCLANLLAHPLQLLIASCEIHANMWTRNGLQMKGQVMTYVQNHFCTSFSDLDLFLIQVLASHLDPDNFINMFFERFHILNWLKNSIRNRIKVKDRNSANSNQDSVKNLVETMLNNLSQNENSDEKFDELEPSQMSSMLISSLTTLAQIITIRPNLSLKSYSLTRKEIVNLLSVSDRTYSQTEESLPDVCSLSMTKKFIKQILGEVSDYLQPSLDILSIGNLKQGRYKPKDSIWLNEYDPLFVMLRSVKMREFQESFDRYCHFLEKKMPKKKFWPPFQIPNDNFYLGSSVDQEIKAELEIDFKLQKDLSNRHNLLNTKILHAILINLLYEHFYLNPLAEKILYFLVFVLELAVHDVKSSLNQTMETNSETNSNQVLFDEKNPYSWFKSNRIEHNLHTFVSFSQYEKKNEAKTEEITQVIMGNQKLPPLKRICSGLSPTCSRPSTPLDSLEDDSIPEPKTTVHESIISLLVKILHRNQLANGKNESKTEFFKIEYHQDLPDPFCFKKSRVGDENDYLINLLEKISNLNEKCRLNIEKTVESINAPKKNLNCKSPSLPSSSSSTEDDLNIKKMKAKARQQRLLAQMSSSQKAFLSNPVNKNDIDAYKASEKGTSINTVELSENQSNSKIEELSAEKKNILVDDQSIDCCICQLSASSTPERPLGVVALLQATNILGNRESCSVENPIRSLLTEEELINESNLSLCWKRENFRAKNMMEAFKPESCKYSVNIGWQGGVYAQMCGHYLHFDCYSSYRQALVEKIHSHRINQIDFACPLCRQTANCVLPLSTNLHTKSSEGNKQDSNVPVVSSTISNVPAKIWILSSLADKMNMSEENRAKNETIPSANKDVYEKLLSMLKFRSFLGANSCSKTSAQFKNDALTIITLSTPIEFRHLENKSSLIGHHSCGFKSPVDDDIVMFTTSVLRTQLEIDLMLLLKKQNLKNSDQCGIISSQPCSSTNSDNFLSPNKFNFKKKKLCFLPLLDVISTHCRLMCHETKPHAKQWLMLTNPNLSKNANKFLFKIGVRSNIDNTMEFFETECTKNDGTIMSNLKDSHQSILQSRLNSLDKLDVPVLLKDPIAVLLLIVVNLPHNFEKIDYNIVVTVVFNMVFIQAIIDFVKELDEEEKINWSKNPEKQISEFSKYISHVICYAEKNKFLKNHLTKPFMENNKYYMKKIWTPESAKNFIETKCLHFLNIASLLKFYLYDEDPLIFKNLTNSFDNLINYLNISESSRLTLKWADENSFETIDFWLDELEKSSEHYNFQVQNLINLSFDRYHFPQLVKLPYTYSDLFNKYLNKKCKFCSKTPVELAVCLVCGSELCFKCNFCCDMMRDSNKKHTNSCGAGTLILLHVNSTYVYIERNKRSAVWASLYLDEHGEEDKDLKRGKPLFLNEQRYNLLKSSWYSHTFDYQSLKWSYNSLLNY